MSDEKTKLASRPQLLGLGGQLVQNMPADLSADIAQKWADNPEAIRLFLANLRDGPRNIAPPARPPLVGVIVKTIVIPAYNAASFAEAVCLGKFNNDTADIVRQFAGDRVGLSKPTKVELVEFDRDWWNDEALAWGKENGNKKPIETAHTMGIAIKHPNEQRARPIVELVSVRDGRVLCLNGHSDWRYLSRHTVKSRWSRLCLVGFLSE